MGKETRTKEGSGRPRKQQKDSGNNQVSQARLKKRIRDVQRLLGRETLKANIREDNERALASLKHQLELAVKSSAEHKMAKRYQMVRFVERQKATRRLRQAEKMYHENPSEENKRTVENYTLDLYYTTHFPLTEKYIALYPKSEIQSEEVLDKRDRIRKELQQEMLYGKKRSSGSNSVELGSRTFTDKDVRDEMSDEGEDEEPEESGDDEFLDMGHKNR